MHLPNFSEQLIEENIIEINYNILTTATVPLDFHLNCIVVTALA